MGDLASRISDFYHRNLIVCRTAWGGYYFHKGEGTVKPTTMPFKAQKGRRLTCSDLREHVLATEPEDVVGAHTVHDGWARWIAFDVDNHGGDILPEDNLTRAMTLCAVLRGLGLTALLEDSDGRGGFHVWCIAGARIKSEDAYRLAVHVAKEAGYEGERFPKQPALRPGGLGNWVRLPGKHPKRDHTSKFYHFETDAWVEFLTEEALTMMRAAVNPMEAVTAAVAAARKLAPPKPKPAREDKPAKKVWRRYAKTVPRPMKASRYKALEKPISSRVLLLGSPIKNHVWRRLAGKCEKESQPRTVRMLEALLRWNKFRFNKNVIIGVDEDEAWIADFAIRGPYPLLVKVLADTSVIPPDATTEEAQNITERNRRRLDQRIKYQTLGKRARGYGLSYLLLTVQEVQSQPQHTLRRIAYFGNCSPRDKISFEEYTSSLRFITERPERPEREPKPAPVERDESDLWGDEAACGAFTFNDFQSLTPMAGDVFREDRLTRPRGLHDDSADRRSSYPLLGYSRCDGRHEDCAGPAPG